MSVKATDALKLTRYYQDIKNKEREYAVVNFVRKTIETIDSEISAAAVKGNFYTIVDSRHPTYGSDGWPPGYGERVPEILDYFKNLGYEIALHNTGSYSTTIRQYFQINWAYAKDTNNAN